MSPSLTRLARIVARAGCLLSISAVLAVPSSQAKEERRDSSESAIEQMAPLSHHSYDEIITELPPLKPYKKNATAKPVQPVPAAAQPAPLDTAKKADAPAEAVAASQPPQASAPQPAPAPVEAKETTPVEAKAAAPAPEAKPAPVAEASPAASVAPVVTPASPTETAAAPQAAEAPKPAPASAEQAAAPTTAPAPPQEGAVAVNPAPAPATEQAAPASEAPVAASAPAATTEPAAESQAKRPAALDAARIAAIIQGGVKGPAEVRLADRAAYSLPAERIFLPKDKARELVEAAGHQWDDSTVGVVLGAATGSEWLAFVDLLGDG